MFSRGECLISDIDLGLVDVRTNMEFVFRIYNKDWPSSVFCVTETTYEYTQNICKIR